MTLLKIARIGHPVLLNRSAPVEDPCARSVRTLVEDMIATMRDADGLGLAAPQVYRNLRIVVVLPVADRESDRDVAPLVILNPQLELLGGASDLAAEGCLSIPDLRGLVPRHPSLRYRGLDREGRRIEGGAEGLLARILQHEVDHLDGILFPMRMVDLSCLAATSELPHLMTRLAKERDG